ncbi:MAG: alanine--tRNA ligase [Oscillospiraceae bacterium]|nr:alanine--tRNA ligase [Oscillospiraceae bacterium]
MHPSYSLNELREMFLQFFESKGHLRLPSFPLVPQNDKSILLINAGMTPMKPFFTGEEKPPRTRVCTCQKCIRTGDIENVGKTARHGTYFEMLGNFSFGDYFKQESLAWSWEFLTEVVGLEPDRLYPSIYVDDDEAFDVWTKEIGVPADHIYRFGKEDNFWEHGSGPCGPCSEIYYDRGAEKGCGKPDCHVGCECDRYMEVWNNVFSQFNNDGKGNYTELVQKNIDTGMGLERLAVVSQNVDSLFDVDTVMHITNKASEITGAKYGQSHKTDVSLRVITDHIRSATFMIGDGVLPSNEGRGYVLRRLLRRAARHGKMLGVNEPFLYKVADTVIAINQDAYPDLGDRHDYIIRVIRAEEENFAKTIDGGLKIYEDMLAAHQAKGEQCFSGADAFKLYDTYGFPIDMTADMLEEQGMTVDQAGFNELMQEQKARARQARKALGDLAWAGIDLGLEDNTPTKFTGYDHLTDCGKVLAVVAEGEISSSAFAGQEAILVLDQTPLYAEMGGQVADHGTITRDGAAFVVTNVQKNKGGKFLHYGHMQTGEICVGDTVTASVELARRKAIMRAHSATHLLQRALRDVLGDHVQQAGSLVEPDRLRFDFTHFSAITPEQLQAINDRVADLVLDGMPVTTKEMPIEDARKLGAMALFGEKYGNVVRVVSMGDQSIEFCGGTHLDDTAKVGPFRIVSEGSAASGVRRIEAVTGKLMLNQMEKMNQRLLMVAEKLKTTPPEILHRIEGVLTEMHDLHSNLDRLQAKMMSGDAERFLFAAKTIRGLKIITSTLSAATVEQLRTMGDTLRDKDETVVAVLACIHDGKISLLCICGKQAIAKGIRAGDVIKAIAPICGGSGGGKPDSAMGGGKDVLKLDDAMAAVDDFVDSHAKD